MDRRAEPLTRVCEDTHAIATVVDRTKMRGYVRLRGELQGIDLGQALQRGWRGLGPA